MLQVLVYQLAHSKPVADLQTLQDLGPLAPGQAAGLAPFLQPQRHHDLQGLCHAEQGQTNSMPYSMFTYLRSGAWSAMARHIQEVSWL